MGFCMSKARKKARKKEMKARKKAMKSRKKAAKTAMRTNFPWVNPNIPEASAPPMEDIDRFGNASAPPMEDILPLLDTCNGKNFYFQANGPPINLPSVKEVEDNFRVIHNKPVEDDEECIICMEEMGESIMTLDCRHSMHTKCGIVWIAKHNSCPMCRSEPLEGPVVEERVVERVVRDERREQELTEALQRSQAQKQRIVYKDRIIVRHDPPLSKHNPIRTGSDSSGYATRKCNYGDVNGDMVLRKPTIY